MITIVDFGSGNVGSVKNMLERIGCEARITSDPGEVERAEKLILPGVGSFDVGMRGIRERGLVKALDSAVRRHVPVLGICLGMQLMARASEEGREPGLAWIDADFRRFPGSTTGVAIRVPHIGWNDLVISRASPLFEGIPVPPRFYFVHSYYAMCRDRSDVIGTTNYGIEFVSVYGRDNLVGVQFHPEKSHVYGMQLLRNFAERWQ